MMAKVVKRETAICLAILTALAVVPLNAHAQAPGQVRRSLSVGGAGREPCAAWTKAREGTSEQSRQDSQGQIEWVSGFFTAVNLYTEPSGNLHGGVDDQKGMLGSIDTYCKAKPADPLFAAAAGLAIDLKNHPRP